MTEMILEIESEEPVVLNWLGKIEDIPIYSIRSQKQKFRDPRPFSGEIPEWVTVVLHRSGGWWAEILFQYGRAVQGRAHSPGSSLRECGPWRPIQNLSEIGEIVGSRISVKDR